jgi:hypothetical protein
MAYPIFGVLPAKVIAGTHSGLSRLIIAPAVWFVYTSRREQFNFVCHIPQVTLSCKRGQMIYPKAENF